MAFQQAQFGQAALGPPQGFRVVVLPGAFQGLDHAVTRFLQLQQRHLALRSLEGVRSQLVRVFAALLDQLTFLGEERQGLAVLACQPFHAALLVNGNVLPLVPAVLFTQVGEHLPGLAVPPGVREDVPQRHLPGPRRTQVFVSLEHRFGLPVAALVDGQPHVL